MKFKLLFLVIISYCDSQIMGSDHQATGEILSPEQQDQIHQAVKKLRTIAAQAQEDYSEAHAQFRRNGLSCSSHREMEEDFKQIRRERYRIAGTVHRATYDFLNNTGNTDKTGRMKREEQIAGCWDCILCCYNSRLDTYGRAYLNVEKVIELVEQDLKQ